MFLLSFPRWCVLLLALLSMNLSRASKYPNPTKMGSYLFCERTHRVFFLSFCNKLILRRVFKTTSYTPFPFTNPHTPQTSPLKYNAQTQHPTQHLHPLHIGDLLEECCWSQRHNTHETKAIRLQYHQWTNPHGSHLYSKDTVRIHWLLQLSDVQAFLARGWWLPLAQSWSRDSSVWRFSATFNIVIFNFYWGFTTQDIETCHSS